MDYIEFLKDSSNKFSINTFLTLLELYGAYRGLYISGSEGVSGFNLKSLLPFYDTHEKIDIPCLERIAVVKAIFYKHILEHHKLNLSNFDNRGVPLLNAMIEFCKLTTDYSNEINELNSFLSNYFVICHRPTKEKLYNELLARLEEKDYDISEFIYFVDMIELEVEMKLAEEE